MLKKGNETWKLFGDGFGNQSYLTLANLLVQFRYKKTTPLPFLGVFTTMNHVPPQIYKCCLTMFLRYDKICVTLLTSAQDDDRCMTFLQLHETTIGLSQEITAQVFKRFRRNESVSLNVTRTILISTTSYHVQTLV